MSHKQAVTAVFFLFLGHVIGNAQLPCPEDFESIVDDSVTSFSLPGIQNFSQLLINYQDETIAVSARSHILLLQYNLSSSHVILTKQIANATQARKCRRLYQYKKDVCHNYFKLLLKDPVSGNLLACGTNAYDPSCKFYNHSTLSDVTPRAWSSIPYFNGYIPEDPHFSNTAVYLADTGSLITGSSRRPSAYAISRFTPGGSLLDVLTAIRGVDSERWLYNPSFVSSYAIGSFVYVFLRETAVETDSKYRSSRVARVCKDDVGDTLVLQSNWVTFVKTRIICEVPVPGPSFYFDWVVATAYVPHASYNPDEATIPVFYAVFTGPPGSPSATAVCAYGLEGTYQNDLKNVYDGSYYYWDNGFKTIMPPTFSCLSSRSIIGAKRYQLTARSAQQTTRSPLYRIDGVRATALAVDQVITANNQVFDVLFVGFEDGQIAKIIQVKSKTGDWEGKVIELVRVAANESITKLELLQDSNWDKKRLYAVSNSKVSALPLHRCSKYKTCGECVAAQDPYCGWSLDQAKCVAAKNITVLQNVAYGNFLSICRDEDIPNRNPMESSNRHTELNRLRVVVPSRIVRNEGVVLHCVASYGHPTERSVTWLLDGNEINKSSHFNVSGDKLFIASVGEELDGQEVSCYDGCRMATVLLLITETGAGEVGFSNAAAVGSSPHSTNSLALIAVVAILSLLVIVGGLLWAKSAHRQNRRVRNHQSQNELSSVNLQESRSNATTAEKNADKPSGDKLVYNAAFFAIPDISAKESTINDHDQSHTLPTSHNLATDGIKPTYDSIS